MYTSGQFAIMGNVGRKALRIYRDEGLLVPSSINEENGYYYYEESQLITLETIKRLRSIGLSLFEIKQILNGKADEKAIVASKIQEAENLIKDMKDMLSNMKPKTEKKQTSEPDIRSFKKCTCLFVDENVDLEKLGMSVGKLYEKASRLGINVTGNHFALYEGMNDEAAFSMKTCLPVSNYNGEDTMNMFEEKCLHINFTGSFSKISQAYQIIYKYSADHGIKLSDRAYEVFNKDMSVDVYYAIK